MRRVSDRLAAAIALGLGLRGHAFAAKIDPKPGGDDLRCHWKIIHERRTMV